MCGGDIFLFFKFCFFLILFVSFCFFFPTFPPFSPPFFPFLPFFSPKQTLHTLFQCFLRHVYVPCCGRGQWGQDLGHKQDFKQPEPSEVPPWLFLGQSPTAGTGRNFKLAAKHLRNLVWCPGSASRDGYTEVSLPLLSAHTGTCPASNHWPEPQNILSWRGPPSCGCECEYVIQLL